MQTRFEAYLDGVALSSIDDKIAITDIGESSPSMKVSTMVNNMIGGNRLIRQRRDDLSVTIAFEVPEYDPTIRKEIISRIVEWAMNGRWLQISDRVDQKLCVRCTSLPAVDSSLKWLNRFSVTFTAYGLPYWISNTRKTQSVETVSAITKTAHLIPLGNAGKCFVQVSVFNNSSYEFQTIKLESADSSIILNGVGLGVGKTLRIYYDDDWILHIEDSDGNSKLNKRTSASSDDLWIPTGRSTDINIYTGGDCTVKFSMKGLYL